MTAIEEYWSKIKSGEIVACEKIKTVYEYLNYCLTHEMGPFTGEEGEKESYVFDSELANKPVEFIETFCRQTQGRSIGKVIKLELFQRARHEAIFGFVEKSTRFRQYTETMTVEGRKNGKTTENACDALFMLAGDGEGSAENYCLATKREQALKTYDEVSKMIRLDDSLRKYMVNGKKTIEYPTTFSYMRALGSKDLDSFNSHFVVVDELAAIKKRSIYDDMKQSTSARDQALISSISTNGFVRDNIFDAQYDYSVKVLAFMRDFLNKSKTIEHEELMKMVSEQIETGEVHFSGNIDLHFLPFIYELDALEEWTDEECWIKANPGLGTIKKKRTLRSYVNKAKGDDEFKPTVLVKDFNLKQNPTSRWLTWEQLENLQTIGHNSQLRDKEYTYEMLANAYKTQGFRYCIGGFDFAVTTDLAATKIISMKPNDPNLYILQMYWCPEDILERLPTNIKNMYNAWINKGLMRTCRGYKISKLDVLGWFLEVQNDLDIYIFGGGYDPWHIQEAEERWLLNTFGPNVWEVVRQGKQTLSQPMHELKEDLKSNTVIYNNHPIDKWCLSNTEITSDINGNIQPVKPGYGDKNVKIENTLKIDGTLALLDAYTVLKKRFDEYQNII